MKILIVLGGEPPSSELLGSQVDWADRVIAADSGVDPLLEIGVEPDLLTGDFDSVQSDLSRLSCRVERDRSDYATDFEKALGYAGGASELHLLGVLGRRTDHLLTNLLIAAGIDERCKVAAFSAKEVFHRITPCCPLDGRFTAGAVVSLVPFVHCDAVISSGLKWNLQKKTMGVGLQLGQSNVVVGPEVNISIDSGTLFFVVQNKI